MTNYQHVLAAVDFTEEAPEVLDHAQRIAMEHGAQLSVITVIRPIANGYVGMDTSWVSQDMQNFDTESKRQASKELTSLASTVGVKATNTNVLIGTPAHAIKAEAKNMGADLIVIGTHGRHGLGLILGSTANGVLHGTCCDVLAIRIGEAEAA